MLGNKYRMPFHRGLSAIIFWKLRSHSRGYEIKGVASDGLDSLVFDIQAVLIVDSEF